MPPSTRTLWRYFSHGRRLDAGLRAALRGRHPREPGLGAGVDLVAAVHEQAFGTARSPIRQYLLGG
jgi:hypothetical protein